MNFFRGVYDFLIGDALNHLDQADIKEYYSKSLTQAKREERNNVLEIFKTTSKPGDEIVLLYLDEKTPYGEKIKNQPYCLVLDMTESGVRRSDFSQYIFEANTQEFSKGAWFVRTTDGREFNDRYSYAIYNQQTGRSVQPQES